MNDRLSKNNKQLNLHGKVVFAVLMVLVMRTGVMGTSRDIVSMERRVR